MRQKKIFPNIKIKFCVWHYKRALEMKKKNSSYSAEIKENNDSLYKGYKAISIFPFINPDYIIEIY